MIIKISLVRQRSKRSYQRALRIVRRGLCWNVQENHPLYGIQKTLENKSFEKISYKDTLLNEYKLLSYQQQLYQDFLINKADTYKIGAYLDFVREALNKNAIDPFYKDEIYRYNNKYLSLALEKIAYQSNIFTQNL